jgi:tripartite-type tricarboxylate transporter receptor subunit TctC
LADECEFRYDPFASPAVPGGFVNAGPNPMTFRLFAWSSIAAIVLAVSDPTSIFAQVYPARPVTIIVPYAAGGTLDTVARNLGKGLAERLGKPFLVENKAGGGTVIGANAVAKAAPDGYTLLMGSSTPLAINATLYKNLPYDAKTDLKLVALVAASPLVMVVNPAVPIHSFADLIKQAKAKPKSLSYASAGIGSPHHLFMELLMTITGIEMTHIPYRGTPPALTDVIAGQVPLMFCDLISGLAMMQTGKVRPIFTGTRSRLSVLPDVPSASEVGLSDFHAASWLGVAITGGAPLEVKTRLHDGLTDVVKSAAFKASVETLGMTTMESGSLDELDAFVQNEIVRWGEVVKRSGATAQ